MPYLLPISQGSQDEKKLKKRATLEEKNFCDKEAMPIFSPHNHSKMRV